MGGGDFCDEFFFGVKVGLNVFNVYNEKFVDYQGDVKVGFVGGVFFQLLINCFIGI